MNYPLWDVPAGGLLIAGVAILHVFISHFAVGGGLFLVLAERKARREGDTALLQFVRAHSRFFVVVTLVGGAITGVGIWFTIGLVHPEATASLINTFVWLWAIEWTMFITEIAAALVYYYGWDRLSTRAHLRVGWIYFWTAWLSLVVINGILSFMLTPGGWPSTRSVADAYLNPSFLPSVAGRTFAAVGLAGVYALVTASWLRDPSLKSTVARYAGLRWVAPMAVAVPVSLVWYLATASGDGVPVSDIFGSRSEGFVALTGALFSQTASGHPVAQRAALVGLVGSVVALVMTLAIVVGRQRSYGRLASGTIMLAALVAIGGAEWVREDLRKPYVIGRYMFVNGVRLPPQTRLAVDTPEAAAALAGDRFTIDALDRTGVLETSPWVRLPAAETSGSAGAGSIVRDYARGAELFRLECARCHTVDGYLAIRPLVAGKSAAALGGTISQLAKPVNRAGEPTAWNDPDLRVMTWRGRRMPPFVGTVAERNALAIFLAVVGGQDAAAIEAQGRAEAGTGKAYFEEYCSACHGDDAQWPMAPRIRNRSPDEFYELLGRLPALNDAMPAFDGTDEQRRALAAYIATLGKQDGGKEGRR